MAVSSNISSLLVAFIVLSNYVTWSASKHHLFMFKVDQNTTAPSTDKSYHWAHDAFGPCSLTCGGGNQTRNVTCRSTDDLKVVDDVLCDEVMKPASRQPCNTQPCPARWQLGAWGDCSQTCGDGGVRSRNVTCETDGKSCGESECLDLLGPKPELFQKCNEDVPCPKWYEGRWSECDTLCGEGKESRQVICHVKVNGRVTILEDSKCADKKPQGTRSCLKIYCADVDWVSTEWTACDSCLTKTSTRQVLCATNNSEPEVVNDAFCAHHNKPQSQQPCADKPACETMWYATQWGKCSVKCGEGVQGRRVFCGSIVNGTVVEVEESECDPELKYRESKPCSVPLEQCPAQWVMGPWSACGCGNSTQHRQMMCVKGQTKNVNCSINLIMDTTRICDQHPCTPEDKKCSETDFGCCPDRETATTGPFDNATTVTSTPTRNNGTESIETSSVSATNSITTSIANTTSSEPSSVTEAESIAVTQEGTSPATEKGTTDVTKEINTTPSEPRNVTEAGTNAVTKAGKNHVTEEGTSTSSESRNVTGAGTIAVTETGTTEVTKDKNTILTNSITTSESSSINEINTSAITETETNEVTEGRNTTSSEPSSVTEAGSITVTQEGTSPATEVGTTNVTKEINTTSSEPRNVTEARTSAVTETGTTEVTIEKNTISTNSITTSESSSISEINTSAITEPGTRVSSLFDWFSKTETNEVTEGGNTTSSEPSSVTEAGSIAVTEAGTNHVTDEGTSTSSVSKNSSESGTTTFTNIIDNCSTTMFGCCYDNETAATGADGSGCPCNATEFGCCPDGESTAEGPEQRGCRGACRNSQYGCCSDGETPAHGPNAEGCCLITAFGCCPDNRLPAQGPHLEGCQCQSSQYGCCPDQMTAAAGPNNEGCGCQYTQYGCCPDRHTEATGPKSEGCPCSTFQYGCCPDGVTIAKGPQQQGCHCRDSPFKCCGDGETPANSADGADCGCAASKYGCCPDGTTTAVGRNFLGCTDVPENKQAGCSLTIDKGSCQNYNVAWYYDITFGGCTKFWYGGCEGNSNRFATKEICEDICVKPAAKDACKLPAVKGACNGNTMRWYYDGEREECRPFTYGGCLGNDNNFNTRELCQAQCKPDTSTIDLCSLPIERGSCAGNYSRWGFDQERGRCEQFTWGGCEGTANRFQTEAACNHRCSPLGAAAPRCTALQVAGTCAEKEALWSFSQAENRCVPFYYSGCGGNDNRFNSRSSCEHHCPSKYNPDRCTLPYATGECADYTRRWFYDTTIQRCRKFWYGGCGGNANRFESEAECESTCSERPTTTTTPVSTTSITPTPKDICQLPMATGPCDESLMRWFYNADTDSCSQFTYGGCQGNENRFDSPEACESRCRRGVPHTPSVNIDEVCRISEDLEPCSKAGVVWFYDPDLLECVKHENPRSGERCRTTGVFPSVEACLRSCGSFKGIDWCAVDKDPGPCKYYEEKVYYDSQDGVCRYFYYGGCFGSVNRFSTMEECQQVCRPESYLIHL